MGVVEGNDSEVIQNSANPMSNDFNLNVPEVISTFASLNPSAQSSNLVTSSATTKSAKSHSDGIPSVVPAAGGEEPIGVAGLEPLVLHARFVDVVLKWAETTPPGCFFVLPNSELEVLKDHDSKLYLVSPDGKGGKVRHRIGSRKQISGASLPRASEEPTTKGNSQAPLGVGQMDYRPYGHPVQRQTRPNVHDKNLQSHPELLPVKQQPRYQTHSVPSQLPNDVDRPPLSSAAGSHERPASSPGFSKLSSGPRTPAQADKKNLAKDILRALQPSALEQPLPKRPRLDDGLANGSLEQPPAKRHAPGPNGEAASAVNLSSTTADQFVNGVIPPRVAAQPSAGDQELAYATPGRHHTLSPVQACSLPVSSVLPSTLALPQILDQPSAQTSLSTSVTSAPSPFQPPMFSPTSIESPVSLPPPSQKTAQPCASLPPPIQSPVSVMPPPVSTSTSTPLPSQRPNQHIALPSSASTSETILLAPQNVARPPSPLPSSAPQVRSNLTTTKTPTWSVVVEIPPSKPMSTSVPHVHKALTPRPKPLIRSDSVPAIATLATSPVVVPVAHVVSHNVIAQQSSTSRRRSPPITPQPDERQKTPLFLPSPASSPSIEALDDIRHKSVSEDPLEIGDTVADPSIIKLSKPRRSKGRNREGGRPKPYILVPPRPAYLKLFLAKESEAKRRKARNRSVPEGHISISELQGRFSSRLLEEPGMGLSHTGKYVVTK